MTQFLCRVVSCKKRPFCVFFFSYTCFHSLFPVAVYIFYASSRGLNKLKQWSEEMSCFVNFLAENTPEDSKALERARRKKQKIIREFPISLDTFYYFATATATPADTLSRMEALYVLPPFFETKCFSLCCFSSLCCCAFDSVSDPGRFIITE